MHAHAENASISAPTPHPPLLKKKTYLDVKFKIIMFYDMRCFVMFITTVCLLFLVTTYSINDKQEHQNNLQKA